MGNVVNPTTARLNVSRCLGIFGVNNNISNKNYYYIYRI